ncbi:MAG: alpha-hydroxy-acid oxidizing enzyme [Azospirillum brasilense]|nr:MAG: alpha-hydroxy-acid oxidizing enzyme [Azospirillum brasilense]
MLVLDDAERAARRFLPRGLFDFVAGGAESGAAQRGNRAAFDALSFCPSILCDVSSRDTSVSLWGRHYAAPFGIAPMGAAALCAPEGDLLMARAAHRAGLPFILSAASSVPMEAVAREAPGSWYQAYLPGEHGRIGRLLDRVGKAGFDVLVVTADVPVAPKRDDCLRRGFTFPARIGTSAILDALARPGWCLRLAASAWQHGVPRLENMEAEPGSSLLGHEAPSRRMLRDRLCWNDLAWIRSRWPGRLLLKGLLAESDARRAAETGLDGIIVSNHGGRQLDHAVSPLRVLPGMIRAAGHMPVMLDGGIRRGTDVLKAVALGARLVFVGRPMLFAAAVSGEAGVRRMLDLLWDEVDRGLALLGCPSLEILDGHWLLPSALDPLTTMHSRMPGDDKT